MEQQPINVLLIEDEPDLRETLAELLEERGYAVRSVASGAAAVELAREHPFDVVVTDIRTEGQIDGLSALEGVKQHQPQVAGVVITGYSTEDYALRAVKLKVEDYLKKPFQLSTFIQRIESIANQKRSSKGAAQKQARTRDLLLWFSSQLAEATDAQSRLKLERFNEIVEALAEKLALGQENSVGLKIASALAFSEETAALEIPLGIQESLPTSAVQMLRYRHERWNGTEEPGSLRGEQIPLGSRILKLAFALADQSEDLDKDELDPTLLDLYQQETQPPQPIGDARSILAVGLALEDAGERDQALDTFRLLAQDYPGTRSEVYATLAQARLNQTRGNLEIANQAARRSYSLAKRQGPGLAAACGLQAGILVSRQGDPAGRELLSETSRRLNDIRDVGGRAVCILALAHFWNESGPVEVAARTLVAPEFTPEFVAAGGWLTSFLLAQESLDPKLSELLLNKCAQNCPSWLVDACHDTELPDGARARALHALHESLARNRLDPLLASLQSDESQELRQLASEISQKTRPRQNRLPILRVSSFGGFRVFRADQRLDAKWRRLKPKFFLAYLLSLGERSHSDESLLEVFWPGDPDKGRASLRAALSYLRRQLDPGETPEGANYFLKPPGQVKLNPELAIWYDLKEFEQAVKRFRHFRTERLSDKAVSAARQISKLYRGPFLDNCYMDWALEIRARTDSAALDALLFLVDWCLSRQRCDQAVEFAQKVLAIDPTVEAAYQCLMRVYLDQGRFAEALKQFELCESTLAAQLEVEPSAETLKLKLLAIQG